MADEPKSPECDCLNVCCARCRQKLILAQSLETGVEIKMYCRISSEELAPDGHPWPEVPYEAHLE